MSLHENMRKAHIDIELTEKLLKEVNAGHTAPAESGSEYTLPPIDGRKIIDRRASAGMVRKRGFCQGSVQKTRTAPGAF